MEIRLYSFGGYTSLDIKFPDGTLRFDQKRASQIFYKGIYGTFDIHRDNTEWKDQLIQKFKQIDVQQWLSKLLISIITTRKSWKNIQYFAQELSFKSQMYNFKSTIMCTGDSFSSTNNQSVIFMNEPISVRNHRKFQNILHKSYIHKDIMCIILEMAFTQTVESSSCECGLTDWGISHYHCIRNKLFFGHFMGYEYADNIESESDSEIDE
jgi:hypothetical protein